MNLLDDPNHSQIIFYIQNDTTVEPILIPINLDPFTPRKQNVYRQLWIKNTSFQFFQFIVFEVLMHATIKLMFLLKSAWIIFIFL